MNKTALLNQLIIDEGLRLFPYPDSLGITTIGIGRNLEGKGLTKDELFFLGIKEKTTEDIIKKLQETGITKEDACYLCDNDIDEIYAWLKKALPWFESKPDVVKRVLVNMGFMGVPKLLKFKKTLELIRDSKYKEASVEMLNSLWAKQVKNRSVRLSNELKQAI
ncbi:MAG: lysozyme family protein [Candidatus Doudnabacteria bacterium]